MNLREVARRENTEEPGWFIGINQYFIFFCSKMFFYTETVFLILVFSLEPCENHVYVESSTHLSGVLS